MIEREKKRIKLEKKYALKRTSLLKIYQAEKSFNLKKVIQIILSVVKLVKELTGNGLKESKDLVDGAPKPVKEGVSKAEAEDIAAKLKEAGAAVEIA